MGLPKGTLQADVLEETCPKHPDVKLVKLRFSPSLATDAERILLGKDTVCVTGCDAVALDELGKQGWALKREGVNFEPCIF